MSPPLRQRLVAALLGGVVVWRVGNGVGAVVRWLWLGERLGNAPMSVFLVSVVVAPVIGGFAGDAAVRRGVWATTARAHARRRELLAGVAVLPVLLNVPISWLLAGHAAALPLHGVGTLVAIGLVVVGERRYGPLVGGDE
ncbi:MAG: hypothetical protein ABEH90_07750 [Halolamina sp.]